MTIMGLMDCPPLEDVSPTWSNVVAAMTAIGVAGLLMRMFYNLHLHPLAKFPGPWYAASFSVVLATISVLRMEPQFLGYLVKKYGFEQPIRVTPTILMFPRPSALKDIYWDPQCNTKSRLYGSGALGPPHLFTTLEPDAHRQLRRALSNAPWTIGKLRLTWERRFDQLVELFMTKMHEHARADRVVSLSEKVSEFAADIMTIMTFGTPFGFVQNQRDERDLLGSWRRSVDLFAFAGRARFFREVILPSPLGSWILPSIRRESGIGWMLNEADRQVTEREKATAEAPYPHPPDFMQHALDARLPSGEPLSPAQRRAHVVLLIQAGADTTGTTMGSALRFLLLHPTAWARCRAEIDAADQQGLLSHPIQYEETRQHLPFLVACLKETMRLNPSATNLFARICPPGGKTIDGHHIPAGTEMACHAYTLQRSAEVYGSDANEFRPERWLESPQRTRELEAAQFTFSVGPRTCLGKDVATLEMWKLIPEIIRQFDIELINPGKYVVVGGIVWNEGLMGRFVAR
ncbi:cytochrome P450 [Aspergillus japonicus CBS 114.51]|uniref:Cytochrome P450 n=1 Tax=Aspergillus japonicus CBS 114.51 TaxID=1448312 RepID=A0A8T8WLQ7_ASPJA|nr:cytochrome P450 [Aspergillus japonicus CBS 114.51]RAH76349.1 cytochrome P450 [Aspergillus japonicus CBS 114.51]